MVSTLRMRLCLVWMLVGRIQGVSYNQPRFCPNATWSSNGTTFANSSIIGIEPLDMFISTNNTIYIPNRSTGQIIVWSNGSLTPAETILVDSIDIRNLFLLTDDQLYFDAFYLFNGTGKWSFGAAVIDPIMYTCAPCYNIFIDIRNRMYCSPDKNHVVIRKSLDDSANSLTIIAGTGIAGSAANQFNFPHGLFVDEDLDLYVADCLNNRIQLFYPGASNGITVAGNSSSSLTIVLNRPSGVLVDADKYLFIVEVYNNRVVRQGPAGFQCVVGCSTNPGSAADQFNQPRILRFDPFGNMLVSDSMNNRIQKFLLISNSCNQSMANEVLTSTMSTVPYPPTRVSNDISYNQPKLDPYAAWNLDGITFANRSIVGTQPYGLFINLNNTIYIADQQNGRVWAWINNAINPTLLASGSISNPHAVFVTSDGQIYFDNNSTSYQVNQRSPSGTISAVIMNLTGACYGLFVGRNNSLYCSLRDLHEVVRKSLNDNSNLLTMVAGTGCSGSSSNTLWNPNGIFVNENLDLYVADSGNDRIQLYQSGQLQAITVAGSGSVNVTIALSYPTGIVLDADQYLFIVDSNNNRIVGEGPNGFRCLLGCYRSNSTSTQLLNPQTMAFDSDGNIFVVDLGNNRIQKFLLLNNSADVSYNQPKFCSNATWNPNATTFANSTTVGSLPFGLFINTKNELYVTRLYYFGVQVWYNNSVLPAFTIFGNFSTLIAIFVTTSDDIYVIDYNGQNDPVAKMTLNANKSVTVMFVPANSYGLFVDISNSIYCSIDGQQIVVKKWLGDTTSTLVTVAGNGSAGSTSNTLNYPNGIFVDVNFDLYVADLFNDRIQLFRSGELNAITVAGNTSVVPTFTLYNPLGIALDGDKYLFIVDSGNNRIVGQGSNGFRCLGGCSGQAGSSSSQLSSPRALSFDSHGNIFVTDVSNNRIQKFPFDANSCAALTTMKHAKTTQSLEEKPATSSSSARSTLLTRAESSTDTLQPRTTDLFHYTSSTPLTTAKITSATGRDLESTAPQWETTIHSPHAATSASPTDVSSTNAILATINTGNMATISYKTEVTTPPSIYFHPPPCPNATQIGLSCNVSARPCDLLQPCQGHDSCNHDQCSCSDDSVGPLCQYGNRSCEQNPCWNNGTCQRISNMTSTCNCAPGWEGDYCERMINYCANVTCFNRGVCQTLLLDYRCICLSQSYSGRYCDIVSGRVHFFRIFSTSCASTAIFIMLSAMAFVVIMDILKYYFDTDPVDPFRRASRLKKQKKRKKKPVIGIRFIYVNKPSDQPMTSTDQIAV